MKPASSMRTLKSSRLALSSSATAVKRRLAIACCLASLSAVAMTPAARGDDHPEFRLLRIAQWLDTEEGLMAAGNPIRLVQSTTADEATQPIDFGSGSNQLAAILAGEARGGDLPSPFELQEPELPSSRNAATSLSTPAEVQQVQQITQRIETGVAATAPIDIVPSSTFNLVSVPDAAETLVEVANSQTVRARRRSPIGFDTRIRGYYEGQTQTTLDGGFQTPVRGDLDATLTKFDSSLIGSTEVISGPYGLRYGSGFSFLNVSTIPTPRYEGGRENHVRLGTNIRANGGQTYNTATVLGGSRRHGYFANVGFRKGSDYDAGNGLAIPSSYDAFNLFSGFGFDVDEFTKMETKVSYLQQGDTEYAGQFFDVDDLDHYGITHSIIHQADRRGIGYRADVWYNTTNFDGVTDFAGKRRNDFPVLQRVDRALRIAATNSALTVEDNARFNGKVDGKLTTAGIRTGVTKDLGCENSVGAGIDFRYVRQRLSERYDIREFGFSDDAGRFATGMPTAETFDPGFYAEATRGWSSFWRTAVGARLAFVRTQAAEDELLINSNFLAPPQGSVKGVLEEDLDVSDILGSFYVTNDIDITERTRSRIGLGYAERTPNLTDRYSDGLFLSVIQSGFSRVIGDPSLSKERNWQMDVRVDTEYDNVRTRFSAFHAWILDYVTYAANEIADPSGARLLQTLNTDYATLAGFEAYGEADLLDGIQGFASLAYLDGRDREIDQPLSGISPLESRIGLRFVDTRPERRYGLEWGWRIVDNQDRLGTLRPVLGGLAPITLETPTPGFAVSYLRGYLRPTDRVSLTAGIENLFDRTYYEHLNLRLPATPNFRETIVLSPGFTPYAGLEVEY